MEGFLSRRGRWLRWLAIWLALIAAGGFGLSQVVGPSAPVHVPWVGAFILGSAVTFFIVPLPEEGE